MFGMGTGGSLSLWSPRIGVREKHPHELGELNIDGPQKENTAVFTINFMVKPNEQLVTVSSTYYYASTSVLSNRLSSCALHTFRLGDLILGKVSRLYAFSVYPNRTSLPSYATGVTTGSQEVRSSRSSRTKDKPPQISYAHHR